MRLSKRLQAVVDMVPEGSVTADIGCDHGYIPIWLVEKRICLRVIAMDVNKGPLARAKEHIESVGLAGYIDTRLSDGLEALETGEADTAVLAGMGGRLIVRILDNSRKKTEGLRVIVAQPQSEPSAVRVFFRNAGYFITAENMIWEDGKYYSVIRAVNGRFCGLGEAAGGSLGERKGCGSADWEAVCDEYGELLIKEKHPVLREYLQKEEAKTEAIIGFLENREFGPGINDAVCSGAQGRSAMRRRELTARLGQIREILSWMEKGDSDLW